MALKILGSRLLVKPLNSEEITRGRIIIPKAYVAESDKAEVIQVGQGHRLRKGLVHPVCAVPGDVVVYGVGSGVPVVDEGQKYLILNDEHIVAIVKRKADAQTT